VTAGNDTPLLPVALHPGRHRRSQRTAAALLPRLGCHLQLVLAAQQLARAAVAVHILVRRREADFEQGGALPPAVQVNTVLGQVQARLRGRQ